MPANYYVTELVGVRQEMSGAVYTPTRGHFMPGGGTVEIVMYGSEWCPYTWRAKRWLNEWKVSYRYVDVDARPDELKQIADWNGGRAVRPTFDIGGEVLVNPEEDALRRALRAHEVYAC